MKDATDGTDSEREFRARAMTEEAQGRPKTPLPILLVEDALDQAHLVRFLLEGTGDYQVTHVQDGLHGSELAREREWALVITDLNLPGAYGTEVIGASRSEHPDTPVMATTAYPGPEYAERAREEGADDVVMKPLDRDDFLARVAALIRGETPAAQAPEASVPEKPGPSRSDIALQVLAVGIRPGEVELGCGGTLLRHRARGDHVVTVVLSKKDDTERDRIREASTRLGSRFYLGTADPSDPELFAKQTSGLILGTLEELRPDVLYLPSPHRRDPLGRIVAEAAMEQAADIPRIFRYDSGDPTPDFDPDLFLPVGETLEGKLDVLRVFEPEQGSPLHPQEATNGARFWGRFADGAPAEPLEVVRGTVPWEGATRS